MHVYIHAHIIYSYAYIYAQCYTTLPPHTQLKSMIAALHSSREEGAKDFMHRDSHFGWDTIVGVYQADLYRAKQGTTRRVPALRYAYIVRDSWTRLNVLPAKIMQVTN